MMIHSSRDGESTYRRTGPDVARRFYGVSAPANETKPKRRLSGLGAETRNIGPPSFAAAGSVPELREPYLD